MCGTESIRGGYFAVEQGGIRPGRVGARTPPLNIFSAAFTNVAYTRVKADKDFMDALVHLRKRSGAEGRGGATDGEPAPVTLL